MYLRSLSSSCFSLESLLSPRDVRSRAPCTAVSMRRLQDTWSRGSLSCTPWRRSSCLPGRSYRRSTLPSRPLACSKAGVREVIKVEKNVDNSTQGSRHPQPPPTIPVWKNTKIDPFRTSKVYFLFIFLFHFDDFPKSSNIRIIFGSSKWHEYELFVNNYWNNTDLYCTVLHCTVLH